MKGPAPPTLVEGWLGPEAAARHSGQALALALAAVLIGVGLVMIALSARAARGAGHLEVTGGTSEPASVEGGRTFRIVAWLLGAGGVARVVHGALHFDFRQDDFFMLARVHVEGDWHWENNLRVLSTGLVFRAGALIDAPRWWFALANLVALGAAATCLFVLARRAGGGRERAIATVGLFGCTPGIRDLSTWGAGVQQLGAFAVVLGTLVAVDSAAREGRPLRRAGLSVLALGLTAGGVLVKYPVMLVIPPLAWIWGTHVVAAPRRPFDRAPVYLGLFAVLAVQMALSHPLGAGTAELDKLGLQRLPANVLRCVVLFLSIGLALGAAVWLLVSGRPKAGAAAVDSGISGPRGALRAVRRVLGAAWRAPVGWLMVLSLAPFLANGRYFASYYVSLAGAFWCLFAARALEHASRLGPARRWSVVAAPLVLTAVLTRWGGTEDKRLTGLLHEARRLTRGLPPPAALRVVGRCPGEAVSPEASAILEHVLSGFDGREGLRWATGWRGVDIHVGDGDPAELGRGGAEGGSRGEGGAPSELTLRYCDGHLFAELPPGSLLVAPLAFEGERRAAPRPRTTTGAPLGGRTVGLLLLWLEHQIAFLDHLPPGPDLAAEKAEAARLLTQLCEELENRGGAIDHGLDQLAPDERALAENALEYTLQLRGKTAAAERSLTPEAARGEVWQTFLFDYWSGEPEDCGASFGEEVTFCVDPGLRIERHHVSLADAGARCGSQVSGVEPAGEGCLRVTGHVGGCGVLPGGLCLGRGRLRFRLEVSARPAQGDEGR